MERLVCPLNMAFDTEEHESSEHEEHPLFNQSNYSKLISYVYKFCQTFRRSPSKDYYLQDIIKANIKKQDEINPVHQSKME